MSGRARRDTAAARRRAAAARPAPSLVGTRLELDVGRVAHGGMCVSRHEGRVVFVRHALPGERVVARVTEGRLPDKFLRADAVEVLRPSPDRVQAPCPYAGPGLCGGCDWQHAAPEAQRRLKADVLAEQLRRLAGLDLAPEVEAVAGPADGSAWRTRVRFAVDPAGRAGLRRHRSHEVVPIEACHIAHPGVLGTGVLGAAWAGVEEVAVTAAGSGERAVLARPTRARRNAAGPPPELPPLAPGVEVAVESRRTAGRRLSEEAAGRRFVVPAGGFWQAHPAAPEVLVAAVLDALRPAAGEAALDLYCGAGLFAAALADAVGVTGRLVAVEGDPLGAAAAAANLSPYGWARVVAGDVGRVLAEGVGAVDVVVLDPPRSGAGRAVVEAVAALRPRAVAYVACDPASLARDLGLFAGQGFSVDRVRSFDLFPHTHHMESVATVVAAGG